MDYEHRGQEDGEIYIAYVDYIGLMFKVLAFLIIKKLFPQVVNSLEQLI